MLLNSSVVKGYAAQNELTIGKWVNIHFNGDVPFILTAEITNQDNDMIELEELNTKKKLYIDFKYQGIPLSLNIDYIQIREQPSIVKIAQSRDMDTDQDNIQDDITDIVDIADGLEAVLNALGVQLDEKHISSAGPDDSWDILFQSATAFQDDGYSAEFIIPFSELQLPDTQIQQWKIGFIRKSYQAGVQTVFASFKNLPALPEICPISDNFNLLNFLPSNFFMLEK